MGQPTKYKEEYNRQVVKLCKLGATDAEIGDFFNVTETTINNWKIKAPAFFESIKEGKIQADMNVANSLYNRALGYSHMEEKVFNNNGEILTYNTVKHYPPDTAAMMAWLNNRRPKDFRSKQYMEVDNTNVNIDATEDMTKEERRAMIAKLEKKRNS